VTVLVIGGGPAGLAAAVSARRRGVPVVLVDSSDQLGGQFWRHLPDERPAAHPERMQHGWSRYERLTGELTADDGCEILTETQVWAIERFDEGRSTIAAHLVTGPADGTDRPKRTIRADALVLAPGAHDRTLPFPGWDLPGVFTAGAAQAFAKAERVALGERVVIAGAGPFLLPVAASVAKTGSRVLAVYEASRVRSLAAGWLPKPWRLVGAAGKAAELAEYAAGHVRHRIPYRTGHAVIAAQGDGRVEAVTIARLAADWSPIAGTERTIEADAVCVSHGFTPRLELPIAARCEIGADRFVVTDAGQRTSVPGVFAAGEITGIGGVDAALAEGAIAGHCAAGGEAGDAEIRAAVRSRRVFDDFTGRIEAAHGIRPGWTGWLTDDTVVCRCEEVPYGRLRSVASASSSASLRALTLGTRAGLGICQARICGRTVEDLAQRASGCALDGTTLDRRPIASPIRLGELAADDAPRGARTDLPPTGAHQDAHGRAEQEGAHGRTEQEGAHGRTEQEGAQWRTEQKGAHGCTEQEDAHGRTEQEGAHGRTEHEGARGRTEQEGAHGCTERKDDNT